MKAPTPAQIKARERFAAMSRSGAFKRKAKKARAAASKSRKRNPASSAGEFFVRSGNDWISGRTRTGGWATSPSFNKALALTSDDAAAIKSHCDRVRVACQVVPVERVDFADSVRGELRENPKARARRSPKARAVNPVRKRSAPRVLYTHMELRSKSTDARSVHLFHFTASETAGAVQSWKLPAALVKSADFQAWARGNNAVVSDTRSGMYARLRRLQGKA